MSKILQKVSGKKQNSIAMHAGDIIGTFVIFFGFEKYNVYPV